MEFFSGLIALIGLIIIAIGGLYYVRPDIQWSVQKSFQEFWGDVKVEQGENWGCWSRIGALTLIGSGIFMLCTVASVYREIYRSEATMSSAYTQIAATRTEMAIDPAEQSVVASLEAIFVPLRPTLEARAQIVRGDIQLLPDAERRRYGLQSNPVYFGICGTNNRFYVIVENWGPARATYQYAYPVSGTFPHTDCGRWQMNAFPYSWVRMPADSFDYTAELREVHTTATPRQ